jgi:hypothetical protein
MPQEDAMDMSKAQMQRKQDWVSDRLDVCLTSVCHAGAGDGVIGGAEGARRGAGNGVDGKLIRLDKMGCSCRG